MYVLSTWLIEYVAPPILVPIKCGLSDRWDYMFQELQSRIPDKWVKPHHTEWWVPAEELERLNDNIVGVIEVIGEYRKQA